MNRQTLCVDFDGVIHSYGEGWQGGKIYGHVTPGFFEWADAASKHFDLVIYSSRSATPGGRMVMKRWLRQEYARLGHKGALPPFRFDAKKPPAWLTIDDRCIRFDGDWNALTVPALQAFRPWHERGTR